MAVLLRDRQDDTQLLKILVLGFCCDDKVVHVNSDNVSPNQVGQHKVGVSLEHRQRIAQSERNFAKLVLSVRCDNRCTRQVKSSKVERRKHARVSKRLQHLVYQRQRKTVLDDFPV